MKQHVMKPAQRIQSNILAAGERRLLIWLCARMPPWVTPDFLTGLGFVGAISVFLGYALSVWHPAWLWLAIAGYGIHWFGDSLDGSLARYRQIERPAFGYFIDHSTDALANLIAMAGLGLSIYVDLDVALFTLAGYLLLSIHAFLAARVVGEIRLSYLAGGPTELRLTLVAMTIAMLIWGPVLMPGGYTIYDWIVGGVGVILVGLFIAQTMATARVLRLRGE
jgi:phosphatidylglycerophosphate synthase